jgi:hypothetical protein
MRTASPTAVRWFVALAFTYLVLCYALRSYVPPRFTCNADSLFISSIFGLISVLCVMVGEAGYARRSEHPVAFWGMVGVVAFACVFFALAGLGVLRPACID